MDLMESNIEPSGVNELMQETPQNSRETEIDVTGKPEKISPAQDSRSTY